MEDSSPDVLAQILHLSKNGQPAPPAAAETLETQSKMVSSYIREIKDSDHCAEAFASQYLPSLVHSFVALGSVFELPLSQTAHSSYLNAIGLCAVNGRSSVPRFVRDFPDEASAFFLKVADTVVESVDWLLKAMKDSGFPGAPALITMLLETLGRFSIIIGEHSPTTSLPVLPPASKQFFHTLTTQLLNHGLPEITATILSQTGIPIKYMTLVLGALGDGGFCSSETETQSVWWACEIRFGRKAEESSCVKLQEGHQMMACSRCLAVRYCSREHQKADWKRHKRLCFKPTW